MKDAHQMPRPTFKSEVLPPEGDHGPIIHCWGEGFDGPFDEEFECWPEIQAKALNAVEVVNVGGSKVAVADLVDAIRRLLITKREEQRDVPVDEGADPMSESVWVDADDVQRWHDMIESDDIQVPAEAIGSIYEKALSILNRRPTSRSRRT
jgi:hypothetical protein